MRFIDYVKKIFNDPTITDEYADAIIWGCTGFPSFWHGDPMKCFTKQLRHAKRSLARGFNKDQIFMGEDKDWPKTSFKRPNSHEVLSSKGRVDEVYSTEKAREFHVRRLNMREIIKSMQHQIKECIRQKKDLNETSWGYEEGVLLSVNEAQMIIDALHASQPAADFHIIPKRIIL